MKYTVEFTMHCRFTAEVDAPNEEMAINKAYEEFEMADFGQAEFIDGDVYHIEDEDGHGGYLD